MFAIALLGKTNDGISARLDLVDMGIREWLHAAIYICLLSHISVIAN